MSYSLESVFLRFRIRTNAQIIPIATHPEIPSIITISEDRPNGIFWIASWSNSPNKILDMNKASLLFFQLDLKLFEQYMAMFIVGIFAYIGNLVLSVEVHENAHYLVCKAYGYEAIRAAWNRVECNNHDQHVFEYRLAGGITAAGTLLWPLAFWKKFKSHIIFRAILVVSVGYAVSEFGKGISEAVNFPFYVSDLGDGIFAATGLVTMLTLGFILRPKRVLDLSL